MRLLIIYNNESLGLIMKNRIIDIAIIIKKSTFER